jgi:hypothetical protein
MLRKSGDILTIFEANEKISAAWSRDWAVL